MDRLILAGANRALVSPCCGYHPARVATTQAFGLAVDPGRRLDESFFRGQERQWSVGYAPSNGLGRSRSWRQLERRFP
jgi:hypothetical protein